MSNTESLKNRKKEVDVLTEKILDRMNTLGEEDVMRYRHDPIIVESIQRICEIYQKAIEVCEYRDEGAAPGCRLFREEPSILRRLELGEETLCPLRHH